MKKSTFLVFLTKHTAAFASALGVTALLTALPVQGDTGKAGERLPGPVEGINVTPDYSGIDAPVWCVEGKHDCVAGNQAFDWLNSCGLFKMGGSDDEPSVKVPYRPEQGDNSVESPG